MRNFIEKHKDQLNAREWSVIMTDINANRSISWLSEDSEKPLFVWYLTGKTTKQISEMTCIPESIVLLTSLRYDWKEKLANSKESGNEPIEKLVTDLSHQVFALTMLAVQKDIQDVMAGKKDPRDSLFIPQTSNQLVNLLKSLQGQKDNENQDDKEPEQVINNTQINIVTKNEDETKSIPEVINIPHDKIQLMRSLLKEK